MSGRVYPQTSSFALWMGGGDSTGRCAHESDQKYIPLSVGSLLVEKRLSLCFGALVDRSDAEKLARLMFAISLLEYKDNGTLRCVSAAKSRTAIADWFLGRYLFLEARSGVGRESWLRPANDVMVNFAINKDQVGEAIYRHRSEQFRCALSMQRIFR